MSLKLVGNPTLVKNLIVSVGSAMFDKELSGIIVTLLKRPDIPFMVQFLTNHQASSFILPGAN